jgi:hypothetical protein
MTVLLQCERVLAAQRGAAVADGHGGQLAVEIRLMEEGMRE